MLLALHPTSSRQHSRDICQGRRAAALSICVLYMCDTCVSAAGVVLVVGVGVSTSHNSDLLSQIVDELGALLSCVVEQFPHQPTLLPMLNPNLHIGLRLRFVQLTLAEETHNLIRTLHTLPYPRHTSPSKHKHGETYAVDIASLLGGKNRMG